MHNGSMMVLHPVLCWVLIATSRLVGGVAAAQLRNVFILAGQSNMVGLGGVVNHTWDGVVPTECSPSPSILRLNANLSWVEARQPLHADIDAGYACGIGPGMPFAAALLSSGTGVREVGLVPCAIGGTKINEWARGTKFYDNMVRRSEAAAGGGGAIRAVLWYQGESDTNSRADAESYKGKFETFVRDVRADLRSPTLPVVQVALASGTGPFIDTVRAAQLGTQIRNVRCVDAKGLPLEPDGLHLSTRAQVALGKKMAHAYLQILSSDPDNKAPEPKPGAPITSSSWASVLLVPLTVFRSWILIALAILFL